MAGKAGKAGTYRRQVRVRPDLPFSEADQALLQLLLDPTRLALLGRMVRDGRDGVLLADLVEMSGISEPGVRRHLGLLRVAGVLHFDQDGNFARYRVNLDPITRLLDDVREYLTTGSRPVN